MRTRSSSNLIFESSTTLKHRNRRRSKQRVEPFSLEETSVVTMADQRTMAENTPMHPTAEGYKDAIVNSRILAENFSSLTCSGNGWMRYEDGGESLENVVESGVGGDGGLKGCLVPWFVKPRSPKTLILMVPNELGVAFCPCVLVIEDCVLVTAFCLKIWLRFASRPLRFASRPLRFASRPSPHFASRFGCVLLQDHCVLLQDHHCILLQHLVAFCLKTILRFDKKLLWQNFILHCVLSRLLHRSIDQGPFELGTTRDALGTTSEGGVLLGPERPRLPKDIYKLINHNIEAKAIWDNVKMLLAGSELIKEDRESQLIIGIWPRNGTAGNGGAQNRAGNANAGQGTPVKCYNCNGVGHIARNCTQPKRTPLMQMDNQPVQNLALNEDNIFQADECDAFDSDVDDEPTAQSIFMANVSSVELENPQAGPSNCINLSDPQHVPVIVSTSEEELELAEATRNKLHVKMNDSVCVEKRVNITPPNYSKENFMATFTPQTQLTPEQVFWSLDLAKRKAEELKANATPLPVLPPATVYPPNTPAHLVPRTLPTTSQVNIGLYVITQLFWDFEKTCKKRIIPTDITEGERGFEQTKRCYLTEVIPFFNLLKEHFDGIQKSLVTEVRAMKAVFENLEAEVDQNETDLQSGEIERKNLLITNENLVTSSDAPSFDSLFVIRKLNEQIQSRGNRIHELKEKISRLTKKNSDADPIFDLKALVSQNKDLTAKLNALHDLNECFRAENAKVKQHYKELYDSIKITRTKTTDQNNSLLSEIEHLKDQLKENSKCVTIPDCKPKVLAPGRYPIDVELIPPRLKKNREVHLHYIERLKENVETLCEIVEDAKIERPLDTSLASACRYTKHSQELLEYVIGTCPKDFGPRDKQNASTNSLRKKGVTFVEPCETSTHNTPPQVEHQKINSTNVPGIPSTGVKGASAASRSKPRSNTKKDRTLPAKSALKQVEAHSRMNKSNEKKPKKIIRIVLILELAISVLNPLPLKCGGLSKLSKFGRPQGLSTATTARRSQPKSNTMHDKTLPTNSVPKKNVEDHPRTNNSKLSKKNHVKQTWKPTGKVFTTVGYHWKPTGKIFPLGAQCPLTMNTKPKVMLVKQWKPTGRLIQLGGQCPLVRPTALNRGEQCPLVRPTTPNSGIMLPDLQANNPPVEYNLVVQIALWHLDSGCSKHMTGDRSRLRNFMKSLSGLLDSETTILVQLWEV
ncbi:retrovirus-related pol polyprotein from transposon TNT 1-94 [Tanacetum coccineum]